MNKNVKTLAFALAMCGIIYTAVHALTIQSFNGLGANSATTEWSLDDSGNVSQNGDLNFYRTSATSAFSPSSTSGNSGGITFPAYLGGSTAAVEGSTLIIAPPISSTQVTVQVANASASTKVVGVAAAAASVGSIVQVYTHGWVLALTTGTVVAGDVLVSTTTAGYLFANNSASANQQVGIAISTGTAAGGLALIQLK